MSGERSALQVKVGDIVALNGFMHATIEVDGEILAVVRENEILAILDK